MIKFRLEGGKLPSRGSRYAAGLDIHSKEQILLGGNSRVMVRTGVFLADCPKDIYLRVAPRSKLAHRHGIDVLAGVVDCDYRGEICVILHKTSEGGYLIDEGEAIAQLVPELIRHYDVKEVFESTETERGSAGINSTNQRR